MKITIRGLDEVQKLMKELPRGYRIAGMRAIATYIIGDKNHGLSHEPERVQHGAGNPYQWQSEKQRRAYFATDGFGAGIPYTRTHDLADSYTYTETDSNWTSVKIDSYSEYVDFVMGDYQQRGHAADGWRKVGDIIDSNIRGAVQAAQRAVDKLIKKLGL
jgi:hypothetical protein